ncbi:HD domain-containing protein [Actinoplanes sp. TBRC 11911]|uniref:HD domain-containing protein n=1 Tax=Actinoplanes sp. TBRC 11911 TaxID=2729386 RepID=UPI00145F9749|nr:HD domain-containing protein [Actinoplanes sp. TBRC 11911]NMO51218.1 HD domain-containing protein [Actinoplanes sp. TBRC 11911]
MAQFIAGIEVPDTAAATEASALVTDPLIYHHSRRIFLFSELQAQRLDLKPDPELLYLAAMFHDAGLLTPFSDAEQRFELDGADHARDFLQARGFSAAESETVWTAVAMHTTPGIAVRMGPEAAALHLGVLTEMYGLGLDRLDGERIREIVEAHPRGDFPNEFFRLMIDGLRNRPATVRGTVWSDVLEHFLPGYERSDLVAGMLAAPWQR